MKRSSSQDFGSRTCMYETKDFLNMEFAFKYGIWEFLIHVSFPETQLLAAKGYGNDLNFLYIRDQLIQIIFDRIFCDLCVF